MQLTELKQKEAKTGIQLMLCDSLSDLNQFLTNATSHTKAYWDHVQCPHHKEPERKGRHVQNVF